MKELSKIELLNLMDPDVWDDIAKSLAQYPDAAGLVVFENQTFDSSEFGARTVCVIGPSNTYGTPKECEGKHINDLPSQRQHAAYYWLKWREVPDLSVRHIWACETDGCEEHAIGGPDSFVEVGNPMCSECDEEMVYQHTEILENDG